MAKFDYDDMAATALELIDDFGQPAIWRQLRATPGPKAYDPAGQMVTDRPVTVALLPLKRVGKETIAQSANEQRTGNVRAYMGQVDFVPSAKDVLVIGDVEMRVANVTETNPAGTSVLFEIEFEL